MQFAELPVCFLDGHYPIYSCETYPCELTLLNFTVRELLEDGTSCFFFLRASRVLFAESLTGLSSRILLWQSALGSNAHSESSCQAETLQRTSQKQVTFSLCPPWSLPNLVIFGRGTWYSLLYRERANWLHTSTPGYSDPEISVHIYIHKAFSNIFASLKL